MDIEIKIDLRGDAELFDKLASLPHKVARKLERGAILKVCRLIARLAKQNLAGHQVTGLLKASLGTKTYTARNGAIVGIVGPRRGTGRQRDKVLKRRIMRTASWKLKRQQKNVALAKVDPVKYAHLVERGHHRGKGRSAAPAYPFLTRAVADASGMAQDILRGEVWKAIREAATE
jgi:hypothetical protein